MLYGNSEVQRRIARLLSISSVICLIFLRYRLNSQFFEKQANSPAEQAKCEFNLILGNIACAQANMLTLGLMINELPEGSLWSAGGVGNYQLQMNAMAIVAGGGVRVGLEDNIWYDQERTRLASNCDLIERIANFARALGREPYTAKEARKVLGL
jgi:uncharacterized protein (DUF849 family)